MDAPVTLPRSLRGTLSINRRLRQSLKKAHNAAMAFS